MNSQLANLDALLIDARRAAIDAAIDAAIEDLDARERLQLYSEETVRWAVEVADGPSPIAYLEARRQAVFAAAALEALAGW